MKKLLTFCSLLAGCLLHFHTQAQAPLSHVQGTSAVQAISGMDVQVSPGMQVLSLTPSHSDNNFAADSLPHTDVFQKLPGRGYNGHLLVQKVPRSYHGHLLVKTPPPGNRHLRVVPPAGIPQKQAITRQFPSLTIKK